MLFLTPGQARAAVQDLSQPVLRIDTDMHTASINRLGSDSDNRFLLTASDDKTLKLWSLDSAELLRTYRGTIGDRHEGKLFAGAISPDARWVVGAGWTKAGHKGRGGHNVYVFNRANGRLEHRLGDVDNAVYDLCFSPDNRYLAAVLSGGSGLRVWSTEDFREVARDTEYGADSYACEFGPDGRLATTALDGYLRIYNHDFQVGYITRFQGWKRPYSLSFSPSQDQIAVGFIDSTQVSVLSATDLSFQFRPDTSGISNGNLSNVAWSRDGRHLWAAGMYDDGNGSPVVRWQDGGRGRLERFTGTTETVQDLVALKDGGVIAGSSGPSWTRLAATGETQAAQTPMIANMRGKLGESLQISDDARRVYFGLGAGETDPVIFDFDSWTISEGRDTSLRAGKTKSRKFKVRDWHNNPSPKIRQRELAMDANEVNRSLVMSDDDRGFVLGSDWALRYYDAEGNLRWRRPIPGSAFGLNMSADGQLLVAAHGDGTLRWYRALDGEELLALFVNPVTRQWVAWSPAGYYNTSAGGSRMIGWHLNKGVDSAAEFYPASQLRKNYYAPEVLDSLFSTLDIDQSLAERGLTEVALDNVLPPTLTLLYPLEGQDFDTETMTLRYEISNANNVPLSALRVLIDGRPIENRRGIQVQGTAPDFLELTLPQRDVQLSVIAENRNGASTPVTVNLNWSGSESVLAKPRLFVLAAGVSDYDDDRLDLKFADKDARDFVNAVKAQEGTFYGEILERTLPNASSDELLDGLEWLTDSVTESDVAMLFLAGHGLNDPDGYYFFLTRDTEVDHIRRTAVEYHDIKRTLSTLSGKTLAFIDTCHSGNIMGSRRSVPDIVGVVNDLAAAENGVVVFASSSGKQYSLEDPAWGNGAFTKALVEGITGQADYTGDGKITINQLDLYLSERVKQLTDNLQTPTTTKPSTIADFPIAINRQLTSAPQVVIGESLKYTYELAAPHLRQL